MPQMKNISQRKFVIADKVLAQGETGEFAQSVIDRHVAMYQGELEQVGFDDADVSHETPADEPADAEAAPEEETSPENAIPEAIAEENSVVEDEPKRGRPAKNKA